MTENIIQFQKKGENKKNTLLQDQKLLCFEDLFKSFRIGIDITKMNLKDYSRPDFQAHSIIFGMLMAQRGMEIDLKTNAIYNFLDRIKLKCDFDVNSKNLYRADLIILNIASQKFDCRFSGRELDSTNQQNIRDTIVWSSDSSLIDQLAVFYHAYLNADLETCQMLSHLFTDNPVKFYEFVANVPLLSSSFISSLPKETYRQILNTIVNSDAIYPTLEDEFYQNAKDICKIKPDFFSDFDSFTPFFFRQIQDALTVFSLEELTNMSGSELCYISGKSKLQLEQIKPFLELNVEPLKIDKILCYPTVIQLGYQKVRFIKNQISNQYNSNKVLTK